MPRIKPIKPQASQADPAKQEDLMADDTHLKVVKTDAETPGGIIKPTGFSLDRFKSKRPPDIPGVKTLLGALPISKVSDAGDYVRTHPNEETHWTDELCFTLVPILGIKDKVLHLIDEDVAMRYLPSKEIKRHRLAVATKPHDAFFFAYVPSQNLDNSWVRSELAALEVMKTSWAKALSRKAQGVDEYQTKFAEDPQAFPEPKWPADTLEALIEATFPEERRITYDDHPAMRRLRGLPQKIT
jgi:hypothetical protein